MNVSADFLRGLDTTPLQVSDYAEISKKFRVTSALTRAVVEVEAAGRGFWNSGNMKMLYEGHIAYRECRNDPKLLEKLVRAGVAWRSWGDVKYGKAGVSIERLRTALRIAGPRAFRWASYGLPQAMGFNAEMMGYPSAQQMFNEFRKGEPEQLEGMFRFIEGASLLKALRAKDWHAFARGYNGPGYQRHGYHIRLKKAHAKHANKSEPEDPMADGILRRGESGTPIADLQTILNIKFDAELETDGMFGRATEVAVREAQRVLGLEVDGLAGSETLAAINAYVRPAPEQVEEELRQHGSRTISEADRVEQVTTVGAGGGILATLLSYLQDVRDFISELPEWLIPIVLIVILAGVWWYLRERSRRIKSARVDDQISGKHKGRIIVDDEQ